MKKLKIAVQTEHHLTTGNHDRQIATEPAPLRYRETGEILYTETLTRAIRESFYGNKGGPVVESER